MDSERRSREFINAHRKIELIVENTINQFNMHNEQFLGALISKGLPLEMTNFFLQLIRIWKNFEIFWFKESRYCFRTQKF